MPESGQPKVLIVEDDPYLGMMMKECFEDRNFIAEHVLNGEEGFKAFCEMRPNICILDVMMPIKDGFSLAKEIRSVDKITPFIFTTARSLKEDVLEGFSVGADDYLKKPFSMEELIARVKVILRRSTGVEEEAKPNAVYPIGDYQFDHLRQTLTIRGKEKSLTPMQADLLQLFCVNINQTLDRSLMLKTIWGDDSFFNGRSMDVFITRIRKYLKEDPNVQIVNVRGKGYKMLVLS